LEGIGSPKAARKLSPWTRARGATAIALVEVIRTRALIDQTTKIGTDTACFGHKEPRSLRTGTL